VQLNFTTNGLPGNLQVVCGLEIQSKFRRCSEKTGDAQRGVGSDGTVAVQDSRD
jgi:hypothetical protein